MSNSKNVLEPVKTLVLTFQAKLRCISKRGCWIFKWHTSSLEWFLFFLLWHSRSRCVYLFDTWYPEEIDFQCQYNDSRETEPAYLGTSLTFTSLSIGSPVRGCLKYPTSITVPNTPPCESRGHIVCGENHSLGWRGGGVCVTSALDRTWLDFRAGLVVSLSLSRSSPMAAPPLWVECRCSPPNRLYGHSYTPRIHLFDFRYLELQSPQTEMKKFSFFSELNACYAFRDGIFDNARIL